MTEEERKRLKQIRERHANGRTHLPNGCQDIDFLLALFDSQAAENERLLKLYNGAWLWVQQRVKHPNSGQPPAAMTLLEMLPLLPVATRSACVEKVRKMRDEVELLIGRSTRHSNTRRRASITFQAYEKALAALKSLTLDQLEQEQPK